MNFKYVDKSRVGDHICYYSDLRKLKMIFQIGEITKSIDNIFEDVFKGIKFS